MRELAGLQLSDDEENSFNLKGLAYLPPDAMSLDRPADSRMYRHFPTILG